MLARHTVVAVNYPTCDPFSLKSLNPVGVFKYCANPLLTRLHCCTELYNSVYKSNQEIKNVDESWQFCKLWQLTLATPENETTIRVTNQISIRVCNTLHARTIDQPAMMRLDWLHTSGCKNTTKFLFQYPSTQVVQSYFSPASILWGRFLITWYCIRFTLLKNSFMMLDSYK